MSRPLLLTAAVAKPSEFQHRLTNAHETLVDRMQGIVESERTLKLTHLDAGKIILLPLGKEVDQAWAAAQRRGIAIDLHLRLPVKVVTHATFQ